MDILKPYLGISLESDPSDEVKQIIEQIKELKQIKDNKILNYHLSLFKNLKFKRDFIKRYKEDPEELCCDITMINNIKQSYEENSGYMSELTVGREDNNTGTIEYPYKLGYTSDFDDIKDYITTIKDDMYSDNCFSDVCIIGIFLPNKSYHALVDCEFEYSQDYYGEYRYFINKRDYPIILEMEKVINSNKEELKEIITKYYNENY